MIGFPIGTSRDMPLARDASSGFLPWIIGSMVLLAALALAATMMLSAAGHQWRAQLTGTVTVQILPIGEDAPSDDLDVRAQRAIELLRGQPGVAKAEALPDAHIAALLEPWLGPAIAQNGLPMPRMIDVTLRPDHPVDTASLARQLADAIPGVQLDDHAVWLKHLLSLTAAIEALATLVLALIGLSATATVIFTTRSGLAIHQATIELLHLIGAEDRYVARQFQAHALRHALRGGTGGLIAAAAMLYAASTAVPESVAGILPDLALTGLQWAALIVLPLAAAVIATMTARLTVLRALAKID
jgi:cell division transport system permease protein